MRYHQSDQTPKYVPSSVIRKPASFTNDLNLIHYHDPYNDDDDNKCSDSTRSFREVGHRKTTDWDLVGCYIGNLKDSSPKRREIPGGLPVEPSKTLAE